MSKEKESLERIKKSHYTAIAVMGCERDYETEEAIKTVECAVQRLEAIDNANPSEAMECLKHIKKYYIPEPCSAKTYDCLDTIKQALKRLESIDNANPSEALECLEKIIDNLDDYADFEIKQEANEYIDTIKQALLKAEQDKKKLNKIEKLTNLFYSERRKIGQEYVKWCKENNTLFNDETNMITWVLAIKLKEVLKNE